MPMSRELRQLLTGWVARPRPIGCPETNFGRTLLKALKRNNFFTDFVTWSAFARDKPQWRLLTNFTPTLWTPTLQPLTPSLLMPNQPPADPSALLAGYGNLAPTYEAPAWYVPLAQAQYADTCAADRTAR
jgi:hypothetical protein